MQSLLSKSVAYCIHGVVMGPSLFCCSYVRVIVIVSTCPCPAMHLLICLFKLPVPDLEIQLVNKSLQNLQRYFVVTLPSGFGISSLSKHFHMTDVNFLALGHDVGVRRKVPLSVGSVRKDHNHLCPC